MALINVKLKDGRIVSVREDSESHEGCPICGYGEEHIKNLEFIVRVDWSDKEQVVEIKGENIDELNVENAILLISDVIEDHVDFQGFLDLCKYTFNIEYNKNAVIKVHET